MQLASQWWTYRNTKAKRELGWQPSPHEDTIEATVEWYLEREATGSRARAARSRSSTSSPRRRSARSAARPVRRVALLATGADARPAKRRTAFILGGGASRGAYQAGCLKRLEEEGIVPGPRVGSSIGVCNSLVYASGGAEALWGFWSRAVALPQVLDFSLRKNPLFGNSFFSMGRLQRFVESEVDFDRCFELGRRADLRRHEPVARVTRSCAATAPSRTSSASARSRESATRSRSCTR